MLLYLSLNVYPSLETITLDDNIMRSKKNMSMFHYNYVILAKSGVP